MAGGVGVIDGDWVVCGISGAELGVGIATVRAASASDQHAPFADWVRNGIFQLEPAIRPTRSGLAAMRPNPGHSSGRGLSPKAAVGLD